MSWLLPLVLQVAPEPGAAPPTPEQWPPAAQAQPAQPQWPYATPYGPYPYPYPYPYPHPPPYGPAPLKAGQLGDSHPHAAAVEGSRAPEPIRWFVRASFVWGPASFFSAQLDALRKLGYRGFNLGGYIDGAYFVSEGVGLGLFGGYVGSRDDGLLGELTQESLFVGGQLPLRLGTRGFSVLATPRLGFATGEVTLRGDAPNRQAFAFGGDLGFVSFSTHVGASIGMLYAGTSAGPGLRPSHDLGSFYFSISGLLDG